MSQIPEELSKGREIIEGNFVLSLWKEPEYYHDYQKIIDPSRDFLHEDSEFYYSIGRAMFKLGFEVFDEVSVALFLEDKDTLRAAFDARGGYREVREMMNMLAIENIDVYFQELSKSNLLIHLHSLGFNVIQNLDRFKNSTVTDIQDYYDFLLNNSIINSTSSIKIVDLTEGYEPYVEKWNEGQGVGFPVGYPMLNYHLSGIHKKNLILHVAPIGGGKTTSALNFYVLPAIEAGEKICIIANEQDEEQFRQMLLSTIISNKVNFLKMNRQKLRTGNLNDIQMQAVEEAQEWLKDHAGLIQFVHLTNYGVTDVRRIIKRQSKLGTEIFLFDTLKPTDESSDKSWAEFSEVAKEIFITAQKEDVAVIATAQLKGVSRHQKVLDLDDIGKSKAIAETAGQVLMFRELKQVEKESLDVYHYDKQGKVKNIKLDESKDYIVLFVPKNRYGGTPQIVYERNLDFNTMREIGYCDIDDNQFTSR